MKLFSAIALLGTAHLAFVQVYTPSGCFAISHGDPAMEFIGTSPLEGKFFFTSSNHSDVRLSVEYFNMAGITSPTGCGDRSVIAADLSA